MHAYAPCMVCLSTNLGNFYGKCEFKYSCTMVRIWVINTDLKPRDSTQVIEVIPKRQTWWKCHGFRCHA